MSRLRTALEETRTPAQRAAAADDGSMTVIAVQTAAEASWDRGVSITFTAPPERTHLFDAETGDRIR